MTGERTAPSVEELWALLQEQQVRLEAQDAELRSLRLERRQAREHQPAQVAGSRRKTLSRAGLLKGAAAGVAGLAAAELSGSLGATPSFAATDTNFTAQNGTGAAFASQTYGYTYGAYISGQSYGILATAADATGQLNTGTGLQSSSGSGYGVKATSATGVGGYFSGGGAPILLLPSASLGAPATGLHLAGEQIIDINGNQYGCVVGDGTSIGTWQATGNFRSFSAPARVFGQAMTAGQTTGQVDATHKLSGAASGVPANAKAMYAAVQADHPGVLTIFPGGGADPGIANWANTGNANELALLYMLVPLSATSTFQIHSYLTGNVYVDAWGYLL